MKDEPSPAASLAENLGPKSAALPSAPPERNIPPGKKRKAGRASAAQAGRAAEEARRLAGRLDAVERIARALGDASEPQDSFRAAFREIRALVPCERCLLASWKPSPNQVHYWHVESDVEAGPPPVEIAGEAIMIRSVYESLRPCYFPDLRKAAGPWPAHLSEVGFRSALVVPIPHGGKCVAHLGLGSVRTDAFSPEQIELLQTVAPHLGAGVRSATLLSRWKVLTEVNQKLNQNLDLHQTLGSIAQAAAELLKADHARIYLLDEEPGALRVHATHGRIPPPIGRPLVFKRGEGIIGGVLQSGVPAIVPDVQVRPEWATPGWARRHDIHSYIACPVRDGEQAFGVITCMSQRLAFFGQEDLELLAALASQASVAIHNAKLYAESENQGVRLSTLVEATQWISRGLDLPAILQSISEAAAMLFRGEAGFRLLEGDTLVRAWATPGAAHVMPQERIRVGQSVSGLVAQSGQPLVVDDIASDPRVLPAHREAAAARMSRTGALMSIPVRAGERILGTLNIYREKGYRFDPAAAVMAASLANHAALAIENARLHQAAVSQLTELAALQTAAKALTAEKELPGLLNTIAECGSRLLGADRCLIMTSDPQRRQIEVLYHKGLSEAYLDALRENSDRLLTHRLEGTGPTVFSYVRGDRRYPLAAEVAEREGFRSLLLLPLFHEGKGFGSLNFYWNETRRFEPAEVSLSQAFADQAATAIQKARLLEEARSRARRLEISGEIAKAAASAMEPAELFRTITKEIRRAVPCERCIIASALPEAKRHMYWHIDSDIEIAPRKESPLEVGEWIYREVYETRRIKNIPDLAAENLPVLAHLTESGFRSFIAVPIFQDERCVAHFVLASTQARVFTAEHEDLLTSIAGHLGAAIRNSTLFRLVQERASRLNTLHELNRKINQNLSLNEVLHGIVEAAVTLTGGEISRIFLLDPDSQQLHLGAFCGDFAPPAEVVTAYPVGRGLVGRAVQHGTPIRVGQIQEDPRFVLKDWARREGIRSCIVQPIPHAGGTMGAINCLSRRENHFSDEDLELLGALASQAAIAIHNARLHEAARNRVSELESLQQAANALTTQIELPELLNRIVEEGARLLGSDRCLILVRDSESAKIQVLHADGISGQYLDLIVERFEESIFARVLTATKAPLAVTDALADPRYPFGPDVARRENIRALLVAPLNYREKVFGLLAFYWDAPRSFSPSETSLIQTFADQAAVAIVNARLFTEAQQRASHLELATRMAKAVASTLEPEEIFRIIVREIRRAVPCERCVIASYDEESRRLNYWHAVSEVEVGPPPTGHWLAEKVYETNKPLMVPDLLAPPWEEPARHLSGAGLRSALFVPILQSGRCIANLALASTRPHAFSDAHEGLLTAMAEHLGTAIRNAALYRTAEERASRLASLNLLNKGITENLQVSEVFDSITNAVVELLRADHCLIFMLDKPTSTLLLRATRGIFTVHDPESLRFRLGEGVTGCAAQEASPVLLSDLLTDPRWVDKGWGAGQGAHSYICQPIIYGKEVTGVIGAFSAKRGYFTEEDLGFVGALASQAAIAIQNATLHEEERRSREFFRSVVEDNADAIVLTSREGKIILWNPAAERFFGHAEGEVLGRPLARIIVPPEGIGEWKKTVGENTRKLLAGGRAFTFEGERLRKDGSLLPVSITVSPVINDKGEVIALSSMYKDLTEKKRSEREREEYVERLKTLNMLSQKIGTTLDLEEVLDFIVDSAAWLLDVPFASIYLLQGQKLELHAFRGWIHPRLRGHVFEMGEGGVGQVAEKGEPVYIENMVEDPRWQFREDAIRHGLSSFLGVPLKSDNKVLGVLCCMTLDRRRFRKDQHELITAFANQAAIAVKNAEVYSRLEESFQELRRTQQLMIRAEKLSSLGVLAAGAAHEILNPANIIGIRAQRLARWSGEGSREYQAAEIILRNVRRITRICDDLRRFSRDEPPSLQQFRPDETLGECVRLVEHKLRQGSVQAEMNLGDAGGTLWADQHQIQQVFMNLIANALDVLPAGGRLRISSRRVHMDEADWWEGRVADTGLGIPEDILPRIFDPFFTTKPEDKGTGLGLSVSLGIVESHGGKIWAENNPDGGAAFMVLLPLAKRRRKHAPDGDRG